MKLSRQSHCKINLLLNVTGRRDDGFHELEMLMLPVPLFDRLEFEITGDSIELTCNRPGIPADSGNLAWRAAESFAAKAGVADGLRIHLEKTIPAEGGLGGGSGNAAANLPTYPITPTRARNCCCTLHFPRHRDRLHSSLSIVIHARHAAKRQRPCQHAGKHAQETAEAGPRVPELVLGRAALEQLQD